MKYYYKLQIRFEPSVETFNKLTTILGVKPTDVVLKRANNIPSSWTYDVVQQESDEYFDFINVFLDILDAKFSDLQKLKIERSDISIWMLYEYDGQCNMEFDPVRLKRLGDNGVVLCISCWDSGQE